jgi:hypothetical protein
MKNREDRVEVSMASTLSDGRFFFEGAVTNVSKSGIKVSEIPKQFDPGAGQCTAIVVGQGKNIKLLVCPCWYTEDGLHKEVGFKILSSPTEWALFLSEIAPQTGNN